MVHRADRCSSVNYSDPKSVMVADGKNLWSKAYPCVLRKNPLDLPHWLLNESLPRTFISQRDVKALGHRTVYGPYKSDDFIQKTDGSTVPITWKNNLPHVDLNFGGPSVSNLRPSIDAINNFSIWHDDAFCECDCGLFWTASEKLLLHRQRGHFYDPKIKVFCPDCWVWKWKTAPHGKVRPVHLVPKRLWSVVDVDFKGPYPDSHFSNRYILWIIDQKSDWVEQYPVSSKDQCHEAFEKFLNQVVRSDEKRVRTVRSDNAPEFKGWNSNWQSTWQKHRITVIFSSPYSPWMNGKVERWNATSGSAIRWNLNNVDPLLWDFAAQYVCYIFNRLDRKTKKSPYFRRFGREPSTKHFKRFGCLCY